jgi:hypothetical protein
MLAINPFISQLTKPTVPHTVVAHLEDTLIERFHFIKKGLKQVTVPARPPSSFSIIFANKLKPVFSNIGTISASPVMTTIF